MGDCPGNFEVEDDHAPRAVAKHKAANGNETESGIFRLALRAGDGVRR